MHSPQPHSDLRAPDGPPVVGLVSGPRHAMGTAIDSNLLGRLERLVASHSCELLDAAFRGGSLRLVIDHPEGVTHEHCAGVSREASVLLDAEEFGPTSGYLLEVTSPGLDRELYAAPDYERFRGRRAKVTFTDAATGNRRTVRGLLEGLSAGASGVALLLEDDSGDTLPINIDSIHKARLLVEL